MSSCRCRCERVQAIVRPAIVCSAKSEPLPGWVEGVSGAGAVILAVSLGVLKLLPSDGHVIGDLVRLCACSVLHRARMHSHLSYLRRPAVLNETLAATNSGEEQMAT